MAQGCSLSPILVFINDLLKELEQTGLGIQLSTVVARQLEECCLLMIL